MRRSGAVSVLCSLLAMSSAGAQLVPKPADVTFGGSGIPGPVRIATVGAPGRTVDLILGASPRFDNPVLLNNGTDTYYATAGQDASSTPVPFYAKWNFNFYIGGPGVGLFNYFLFYDFDPAPSNGGLGSLYLAGDVLRGPVQNSWNLGMNFLSSPLTPDITLPAYTETGFFDPNAAGTYRFALAAIDRTSTSLTPAGTVIIDVVVAGTAVPEPESVTLVAAGLVGLIGAARMRGRLGRA